MVKLNKKPKHMLTIAEKDAAAPVKADITNKNKINSAAGTLLQSVNSSIFQNFKDLTDEQQRIRNQGALQILLKLEKIKKVNNCEKELIYTLKRLVRGCGASRNISRAGFYTALVALLKMFCEETLPLSQVFEIMNSQLLIKKAIHNKEDADAVVGRILVCGATLHSGRILQAKPDELLFILNCLIDVAKQRTYHSSLAYSFIVHAVQVLPEADFKVSVWPLLQKDLTLPWPKQTLQTIYCLLTVQQRFPDLVNAEFCKEHLSMLTLLNADSFANMFKIFLQHKDDIFMHPAFQLFAKELANSTHLAKFWAETVDVNLENPNKLLEIVTLKLATEILQHLPDNKKPLVLELLSTNFIKTLIAGLKRCKQKKVESLNNFYTSFFHTLGECCSEHMDDTTLVAVIRRLVLSPGTYSIEKYARVRILHQLINHLSAKGMEEIFELFKTRFLHNEEESTMQKANNNAASGERVMTGYMLQELLIHKRMQQSHEWRLEQLLFLFTAGIFNINENFEICNKKEASSFSREFGEQCKLMFYASLQRKITDLEDEKNLLMKIAKFADTNLIKNHWNMEYMRINLKQADAVEAAWSRVLKIITSEKTEKHRSKKQKNDDQLQLVFDVLILHMGLHLYHEPEMSMPAIEDLYKCMQRMQSSKKQRNKPLKDLEDEVKEPEWIEVVLDLLLHLLSQNSSTLRNIVNAIFPHLCSCLTVNGVHQILAMLQMEDGYNPLGVDNEDEEEEDSSKGSEDEELEEENLDSDDNVEEEDVDEVNPSDILRNAVSQALMANGALPEAAEDDDMDSIDLNDISEEEGRRLDAALATAFHVLKQSGTNNSTKKSKVSRLETITIMHFRIRVLDILELYLQQAQPQLIIIIEIMLSVFNMLKYCVDDALSNLRRKAEKLLHSLTALKHFHSDESVNIGNLSSAMQQIVENKIPAAGFNVINGLRNKCILFLFACVSKVDKTGEDELQALWRTYVQDYVTLRNPTVNITLWCELFGKLRWHYLFELAIFLVENGINAKTRIYRRIQIFEILCAYYRNRNIQIEDAELAKETASKIELILLQHVRYLAHPNAEVKRSSKEFQRLLELILIIKENVGFSSIDSALCTAEAISSVQQLRLQLRLESMQLYQQYCSAFSLPVIKNTEITTTSINKENCNLQLNPELTSTHKHLASAQIENKRVQSNKKKRKLETSVQSLKKQKNI